ncbi:MAG TPA: DUF5777 family beta-barrel protein [Vicinamibacterales bacterium]|nr:DUF5777 family beta-barrel protein [Vicinamibacterales bacterium]
MTPASLLLALACAAPLPAPPQTIDSTAPRRPAAARSAIVATAASDAPGAPLSVRQEPESDDRRLNPAQPDFTVVGLPTTLRMPRHAWWFRVTHRFGRPLGEGDFGDLVGDLFGLDSGALIGLELRFGLAPGAQIGVHRTSDKTIQVSGEVELRRQTGEMPFGLALLASVEGLNNFRDDYAPGLGLVVSHELGRRGALYLVPAWVANTNPFDLPGEDDSTLLVGVGARARIASTVYAVAEVLPRIAGYAPGAAQASFGLEKRVGGHTFQINVSNGFGTTLAQLARGGVSGSDWFLGFNITRKFF